MRLGGVLSHQKTIVQLGRNRNNDSVYHRPENPSEDWKDGYGYALSEARDLISQAHQKCVERDAHVVLDWVWDCLKNLESKLLNRPIV